MFRRESHRTSLPPSCQPFHRAAVLATLVVLAGCGRPSASGEYIAKFSNGVAHLHLVETPDKRIAGELDTAILQPDGSLQYRDMAVSGAADGSNVTLSLKPDSFLSVAIPMSGTFGWGKLTLTGPLSGDGSSPTVFSESDGDAYQAALNALNTKAQEVRAARQEREFVASAIALVAEMQRFDTSAVQALARLPAYRSKMQDITAKMDGYLSREKELAGNPNAGVVRGQLSVTINQGAVATDQVFNQVRAFETQFQTDATRLMQKVVETGQTCHLAGRPDTKPGSWATACLNVIEASPEFIRNYRNLKGALQDLDSHYATTRDTQQRIVDASESIE